MGSRENCVNLEYLNDVIFHNRGYEGISVVVIPELLSQLCKNNRMVLLEAKKKKKWKNFSGCKIDENCRV